MFNKCVGYFFPRKGLFILFILTAVKFEMCERFKLGRYLHCSYDRGYIMLTTFGIFLFFLIALRSTSGAMGNLCPPLCPPYRGSVYCSFSNKTVDCSSNLSPDSVAEYRCQEFYQLEGEKVLSCLSNGSWSSRPPECLPECGKINPVVPLIVNGPLSIPGVFPWHVAIYNFIDNEFEYWCGGSLVSEFAVVTAAHCTWQNSPHNFTLAFGKFHRDLDHEERNVQKIKVREIQMLKTYQDVEGNYNSDLAVMFLEKPVELNQFTRPICLDWDQEFVGEHLADGTSGVVLGWGLTENETTSDFLRIVRLPVVADKTCIGAQPEDFRKFVTYTSFCAGFGNGTGVCNGDSGGGLAFVDRESDRWYLQGLVSVSPRRKGTPFCDPNFYTIFTKVSIFAKWLKNIIETEEEIRKVKEGSGGNCAGEEKPDKDFRRKIILWGKEINEDYQGDFGVRWPKNPMTGNPRGDSALTY